MIIVPFVVIKSNRPASLHYAVTSQWMHRVQSNRFMFLTNHNVSDIFYVSP